ncbi:MAG: protein transcription factor [Acidobacteria bacterium]|nr:MAG: protein transcription factor [Acidobacteriota bacterium]
MSLNIKDPEAHKLAQELARETGESMTSAVIQAIRERLEAVLRRRKRDAMRAAIMAIGRRGASLY